MSVDIQKFKKIIIAEKPDAAKKIAAVLKAQISTNRLVYENDDWIITSAAGHLYEFAPPERQGPQWDGPWILDSLPILPARLQLEPIESKSKYISQIQGLAERSDVDEIICATDAAREGERIFRLIYGQLKRKPPFRRLWLQSLTPAAIQKAFSNLLPGDSKDGMAAAAYMRAEADWLVGMNLTRLACILCNSRGLSVGRVQTPVLAMLVNRLREIEAFKPVDYFTLKAALQFENSEPLTATWYEAPKLESTRIDSLDEAKRIEKEIRASIPIVGQDIRKKELMAQPDLYDIGALQKEADRQFGFSSAHTLAVAQALYEKHEAITYPRTDNPYIPDDVYAALADNIAACGPHLPELTASAFERFYDSSTRPKCVKNAESDHHAIIPTERVVGLNAFSDDEAKVYMLIVCRLIAALLPKAVILRRTVHIVCDKHMLISKGKQYLRKGWIEAESWRQQKNSLLPYLEQNDKLKVLDTELEKNQTTPKQHYTTASLLTAMENAGKDIDDSELASKIREAKGIGTPATRHQIIETLLSRNLIEKKKRHFIATGKGVALIAFWEDVARKIPCAQLVLSAKMTGEWEKQMQEAEKKDSAGARESYIVFMRDIKEEIQKIVSQSKAIADSFDTKALAPQSLGICPECQKPVHNFGKVYSCSDKSCPFRMFQNQFGGRISESDVREMLEQGKTRPLRLKSKTKGTQYTGVLYWSKETHRIEIQFPSGEVGKCPKCCNGEILEYKKGFGCSKYKDGCKFYIAKNDKNENSSIDKEGVKQLLAERKTRHEYSFLSRAGKEFSASLWLDENGDVKFSFKKSNRQTDSRKTVTEPSYSSLSNVDIDEFLNRLMSKEKE